MGHSGWMSQEQMKLGVRPIPVNHGGRGKKKMKPLYNQRYPINTKLNDPHTVRMGGMDVVHWMPSKASRFDVVVTETPEDRQTEDYEFVPRNDHGPGGGHAVRKTRYLSPENFDVTIVDRPEDRQTEDYLAIPRGDEEDEQNSETEDYLAIPREDEEDEQNSETEDYPLPREDEEDEQNSETEDYLALPREDEEDEQNSETEDYEFVPRNDHGPGGDHAVRKTRYLRR